MKNSEESITQKTEDFNSIIRGIDRGVKYSVGDDGFNGVRDIISTPLHGYFSSNIPKRSREILKNVSVSYKRSMNSFRVINHSKRISDLNERIAKTDIEETIDNVREVLSSPLPGFFNYLTPEFESQIRENISRIKDDYEKDRNFFYNF